MEGKDDQGERKGRWSEGVQSCDCFCLKDAGEGTCLPVCLCGRAKRDNERERERNTTDKNDPDESAVDRLVIMETTKEGRLKGSGK